MAHSVASGASSTMAERTCPRVGPISRAATIRITAGGRYSGIPVLHVFEVAALEVVVLVALQRVAEGLRHQHHGQAGEEPEDGAECQPAVHHEVSLHRDEDLGSHGECEHHPETPPQQPDVLRPGEPVIAIFAIIAIISFRLPAHSHTSISCRSSAMTGPLKKKNRIVSVAVTVSASTAGKGASPCSFAPSGSLPNQAR